MPEGMTVTKAASLLGVSRPALSNLLNGKAALSPEMANKLARAFGVKANDLLNWHPEETGLSDLPAPDLKVRRHVPTVAKITATDLERWADEIEARTLLPVLLRKLALSSEALITHINFPGYDNAQRPGADGTIEASTPSPWVPSGASLWEFGCNADPEKKANKDYNKRLTLPIKRRHDTTYVVVTPRNWTGKSEWVRKKQEAGDWKDVIAFDASDLEQAIEQSAPVQTWLAEQLNKALDGAASLDEHWHLWSSVCVPTLTPALFADAVAQYVQTFITWLRKPPENPYLISADSKEEALAFLYCLFNADQQELQGFSDRPIVIGKPEILRKLATPSAGFIPVIENGDTERSLGDLSHHAHTIIIRPKTGIGREQLDVDLNILRFSQLEKALETMGISHDDANTLWRKSGGSPTILRRALSTIPEIQIPEWARDQEVARCLCPLWMAGNWNTGFQADKEILKLIAGVDDYAKIEERISTLTQLNSTPVWKVAGLRGTVSKIDALFATAHMLQEQDFDRLLDAAQLVLSERDPAIDLPEEQRWAAGVYGNVRKHSSILRESICETLCILSVHGDELLRNSLGFSLKYRVDNLVRTLLSPLTPEILESQKDDLPYYAEAAPDAFLDIVQDDLKNGDRALLSLMRPAESGVFGHCPRTGLLWALENLAWDPSRLIRVVQILGRLSEVPLDDNWANKPIESLQSIFRSWMPQTAAPLDQRKRALDALVEKFPLVGWELCIDQFNPGNRFASPSHRPYWRPDAAGAGGWAEPSEANEFSLYAFNKCVQWTRHDAKTLSDLVHNLAGVEEALHSHVWNAIESWERETSDDRQKAQLRETIRQACFTRRGKRRSKGGASQERATQIMDLLHPTDLVERHRWLFEKRWVDFSADEQADDNVDWNERDNRIAEARRAAVTEVLETQGLDGIWRLVEGGEGAYIAGVSLESIVEQPEACARLVVDFLSRRATDPRLADGLISGVLTGAHFEERLSPILEACVPTLPVEERHVVLQRLPFSPVAWDFAASLGGEFETRYWREVHPVWCPLSDDELRRGVDALLIARRARAAFALSSHQLEKLETAQIEQILRDMATIPADQAENYRFDGHDFVSAFEELEKRSDILSSQRAQLEFLYVEALNHTEYRLPNLAREIAKSPQMFVEALIYTYKRSDNNDDPERYRIKDGEAIQNIARAARTVLRQLRDIPGLELGDNDKRIEALLGWVEEVRRRAADVARAGRCDYQLGELFSRSPNGEDGLWPCEAVREAIEEIGNEPVGEGMYIGIRNSRGIHSRMPNEGGDQERQLAEKYRAWAEALADLWPSTARILFDVAESYEHDAVGVDQRAEARGRLKGWS